MLDAKKRREDELRELREFKQQKKQEEEERLSKLVNEKIVKKAISTPNEKLRRWL